VHHEEFNHFGHSNFVLDQIGKIGKYRGNMEDAKEKNYFPE